MPENDQQEAQVNGPQSEHSVPPQSSDTLPSSDDPVGAQAAEESAPVTEALSDDEEVESLDEHDAIEALSGISTPSIVEDSTTTRIPKKRMRIYFNSRELPSSYPAYVAWLDVMGSRAAMSQSLARSAHYIGRLHVAILMNRKKQGLQTSPFMDGAYIRAEYQSTMLDFLWGVFEELAHDFLTAKAHRHRFLPRCGLSYGHIIQGTSIPTSVSKILGAYSNTVYREGIYLGYPMIQAYLSETDGPPFGIAIHESARSFSHLDDRPLSGLWWRWHIYRRPEYFDDFVATLRDYFDWCERHSNAIGYARDRIAVHRRMAEEYFDED